MYAESRQNENKGERGMGKYVLKRFGNSDFFSDAFDTGRPLFVAERYAGGRS